MKDPYEVLGVDRNADISSIKSAYRKKAKKYHPDLNPGDKHAEEMFKELSTAYDILQDDEKRRLYDTYGASAFENGGMGGASNFGGFGFDMNDIFGDLFSDLFGGGRTSSYRNVRRKGEDIRIELELSFKEAVFGCKKKIQFKRKESCSHCHGTGAEPGSNKKTCPRCQGSGVVQQQINSPFGRMINQTTCPQCHGEGRIIEKPCKACSGSGRESKKVSLNVNIPAGVDDGNIIPMSGQAHGGLNGGPAGDVYIILRVEPSGIFERRRNDLYVDLPISFSQAVFGDKVEVPVLEGREKFDLPEGTQTGSTFKLKGKGVKDVRTGRPGDLIFRVNIETPKNLNHDQKEALKAFQETMGEETEAKKNFWDKVKDVFS